MRATATLACLSVVILVASGCASFTIEGRGGGGTVPAPPPANHHHDHDDDDQGHDHGHSAPAKLHIPPGHYPPPGSCRVWHPGAPPGHQPAPGSCSAVERNVGPGDWLIYRPTKDKKVVRVSFYDARSPQVRVAVRLYDYRTGAYLRDQ